jgi:outer membrane protein assembly factor BamD
MHNYKVFLLASLLALLTACGKATIQEDPSAQFEHYSAPQLYFEGQQALQARRYRRAIEIYEGLESLYPFGKQAKQGQLNLLYAYYQAGKYAQAVSMADEYIHVYPRSKHVDYAYYMKGLAHMKSGSSWLQTKLPIDMSQRDMSNAKQAFYDFRDLLQRFPHSPYVADARQHMIYLRDLFANHELDIAHYYFNRQAYVAAANRATDIIHQYRKTPQVKDALVILVKSKRALKLPKAAQHAYKVLQINFPHSKELKTLAK